MKKFILLISLMAAVLFSCSKAPEYSMTNIQNLDSEITLFENGLTVPADTLMCFKLDELLKADNVVKDGSGNYFVDARIPQTSQTLDVIPEINIPKLVDDFAWNHDVSEYAGIPIQSGFSFEVATIEGSSEVGFEFKLPNEVKDIESIEFDFPVSLEISASSSMAYLREGFTLQFPKGLRFEKNAEASWFDLVVEDNVCKVVFNKDVSLARKLACGLKLVGIDVQPGWIKDKVLSFSESLSIRGVLGIKGPGTVPETASLTFHAAQGKVEIKGASLKLDASVSIPSQTVDLNLPAEITAEGNVFKFTDTGLDIVIDNGTPFPLSISGTVEAVRGDASVPARAHISSLAIAESGKTEIHVDETVCPGILEILNCLPRQVVLKDLKATCVNDDFREIKVSDKAEVSISGKMHLPLSFARGTRFQIEKAFSNKLDFDATATVSKLGIRLELKNDTPVDLDTAIKLVIDGQKVQIETDDKSPIMVAAGATSDFKLIAAKADGSSFSSIGDIEIVAGASVSSEKAVLNAGNQLSIRVKSVSVPDGITLKLK